MELDKVILYLSEKEDNEDIRKIANILLKKLALNVMNQLKVNL